MDDDPGQVDDTERTGRPSGGRDDGENAPSDAGDRLDGEGGVLDQIRTFAEHLARNDDEEGWVWGKGGVEPEGGEDGADPAAPPSESDPAVVADVIEHFATTDVDWPGVEPPTEEFVRERFFEFDYLAEAEEVDRYWVKRPFAYVSVLYDADSRTNYYHASEPYLDPGEEYIRRDLQTHVRDVLDVAEVGNADSPEFEAAVRRIAADFGDGVPDGSLHKIVYYLLRDFSGYGRIDPLMRDDRVEDISCDGHDFPVFVYHREYRDLPTNLVFEEAPLNSFIRWLAQRAGHPISFGDPVVSATLPRGDRIQLILGSDIGVRGSNFTIRRFQEIPLTPVDLIKYNTFSLMEVAYLWLCVEHQKSVVFVGPTASGKTTSMNAMSLFIRPYAKVVTIERTRELSIPHDNWISTVTRETGRDGEGVDVTVYDLLHSALHQRPEYILIGEIRTEPEVLQTFLQSVFTGHAGYTTFHAYDVEEALGRFRAEPFDIDDQMISSVDIVSVQRQVYIGEERYRRTVRIAELDQNADGTIGAIDAFEWEPETDAHGASTDFSELPALREIADEHGWGEVELVEELNRRRDFLDYLVRRDVTDYRDVWRSIFAFVRDREAVVDQVQAGTFDPTAIELNYYD